MWLSPKPLPRRCLESLCMLCVWYFASLELKGPNLLRQDNALVRKSSCMKIWFATVNVEEEPECPAQSLDLSLTDYLWDEPECWRDLDLLMKPHNHTSNLMGSLLQRLKFDYNWNGMYRYDSQVTNLWSYSACVCTSCVWSFKYHMSIIGFTFPQYSEYKNSIT